MTSSQHTTLNYQQSYSALTSDLGLDLVGILLGELHFTSSRNQNVAFSLQDAAFVGCGLGKADN